MKSWQVRIFYDGDCPLCKREIDWLKKKDRGSRVSFVDIAADDFDAGSYGDRTWDELMSRIHGQLPNGNWLEGVEVFRQVYAAIGFRRLVAVSRFPGIRQLLDAGYRVFARNRLRLTGRHAARCSDGLCGTSPNRSSRGGEGADKSEVAATKQEPRPSGRRDSYASTS